MNLGIPTIPGLRRDLLAVAILATFGNMTVVMINPIMPLYLDSIGIDAQIIGLLASMAGIAIGIGEFSWGWAADRIPLRVPLAFGTFGIAAVMFSFTLTQSLPMLFLLYFLRGITLAGIFPTSRGFIGSTMGAHQKALFLAAFSTVLGFGNSFGAFLGGYVASQFGYTAVFYIASSLGFFGGIIGLILLRAERLSQYSSDHVVAPEAKDSLLKQRGAETASLKVQALFAILNFTSIGIIGTFVPLMAKKVLFLAPSDVGLIFATAGLFGMILPIPFGRLSDRFGRRIFMVAGLALSAFAVMEISFADSFLVLLMFVSLRQIGMVTFQPAAVALFSDTASSGKQGAAMGIYGMCEDLGTVIGPAIGGFLWDNLGPQPTFWVGAAPALAASLMALLLVRRRQSVPATT